jgi:ribosomal protein S27AE
MTKANTNLRLIACAVCDGQFMASHSQARYCSEACRSVGARKSWNKYAASNKPARKVYAAGHYRRNRPAVLARTAEYHQSNAGKVAAKISAARQMAKAPEKVAARQEVLKALRKGSLVRQPCSICGEAVVQAHHDDYSKPLDVIWLCRTCHDDAHVASKAAK